MDPTLEEHRLTLTTDSSAPRRFTSLLEEGVELEVEVGCTIRRLLCEQLGLDAEYVDQRIQTAFLDGRPVDRLDQAVVRDGSTLALSAALPGLLGATLRKNGAYASLRQGITHAESGDCRGRSRGRVTLKAFNVLLGELAPAVLRFGVRVSWERLADRIRAGGGPLTSAIRSALLDGEAVIPQDLSGLTWGARTRVLFVLRTAPLQPPATGGNTPTRSPS